MKRLILLLALCYSIGAGQQIPVNLIRTSGEDTARFVNPSTGLKSKFLTFPDGTKFTTATILISGVTGLQDSLTVKLNRSELAALIGDSLAEYVLRADTGSTGFAKQWWVKDQVRDSLVEYTPRTVQAADTTYKAAQIALKKDKADSVLAVGYYTNEKARVDTVNRNVLIALKKANSDSTLATGYYTNEKARVDTVNRNVLIAKRIAYADTSAMPTLVPARNGQQGWWTRPAGWSYLTPATSTDTLRVPVIWGGTSSALFMDASRNLTAGTGTFTGGGAFGTTISATSQFAVKGVNTKLNLLELYRSSSATAGVVVDSNFNVGIGTTSLTTGKLVVNNGALDNVLALVTSRNIENQTIINFYGNRGIANVANGNTIALFYAFGDSKTTANAMSTSLRMVLEDVTHATRKSGLAFYTQEAGSGSASEHMRITGTGNVGIGTTGPTGKLDIQAGLQLYAQRWLRTATGGVPVEVASIDTNGNQALSGFVSATDGRFTDSVSAVSGAFSGGLTGSTLSLNSAPVTTSILGVKGTNAKLNLLELYRSSSATAGVVVDSNFNVGIGTTAPTGKLDVQGLAIHDLPTYSAEFLLSTGWTSTNWTGDFATGWTHTTGNTTVLSQSKVAVGATKYQIAYTVTGRTAGSFTIGFGGQTNADLTATGAWGPTTSSTASLTITPTTDFDGTIVISIKSITAISTPLVNLKSSDGTARIEMRANNASANTFIGVGAGRYNTTGYNNTANGLNSLQANTTGNNNTANGVSSLQSNTTGHYNTANGVTSLYSNTTGYFNTANGYSSLYSNTTGYNNTANGVYSLYSNTTGYSNTANGHASLNSNTTGYQNTANGYASLYSSGKTATAGSFIVGVSYTIITAGTTDFTLIGSANSNVGTIFTATGVGAGTGTAASNSNNNTAYGYNAGRFLTNGSTILSAPSNSLFLGYDTRASADGLTNENVIGYGAIGEGSNTMTLGNNSILKTILKGNVGIGTTTPTGRLDIQAGLQLYAQRWLRTATGGTPVEVASIDTNGYITARKVIQDSAGYAGVYIEEDTKSDSVIVSSSATYYTLGAVQLPNGYKWTTNGASVTKNCTIQDSSITINSTGVYQISYVADGKVLNMATGNSLHMHIFVDNVVIPNGASDSQVSASNAFFHFGGVTSYYVGKAGTIIKLKVNSPDDAAGTIIFHHANLIVTRVPQ